MSLLFGEFQRFTKPIENGAFRLGGSLPLNRLAGCGLGTEVLGLHSS
jgi:hypothetical protein